MSLWRKSVLVGYARVSTQDQNPALQLDALKASGCEKVFVEKASGAQRNRPELIAALDYIREGDGLVVWKLDRLARSLPQLIETVAMLEQRGVGLRSLTESIDTTTAGGRLIFHVFGALAEFERAVIRERTQAGLAAARSRGKIGGRPRKMTENDVRAAKAMLADGDITVGEVAKRLNIAPSTLYKHLPAARTNSGA
jgi:DNA invertase Pin-like site-specific DNA recombinase